MNRAITLLFISLALLLTGHGLQLSLLPLHAREIGWDDATIGMTGATYFAGFVLGCLTAPAMLQQAGAIRVFASMCAVLAGVLLFLEISESALLWAFLRLFTGWSISAVYTTAESWLNQSASNTSRGQLLSVYVIVTLVGVAMGQFLLGFAPPEHLFLVGALMMMAAILPLALFCEEQTMDLRQVSLKPKMLRDIPLVATAGIFFGGIVTGGIWTLAPLVGESRGFTQATIAVMMNALLFGGALLQLPLGTASDWFGRQRVIVLVCVAGVVVSLGATLIPATATVPFLIAMFLFGGVTLSLYALCAAEGQDKSTLGRVETAAILLLVNGVGSTIGSVVIGYGQVWSNNALFIVSAICLGLIVPLAMRRRTAVVVEFPVEQVVSTHAEIPLENAA